VINPYRSRPFSYVYGAAHFGKSLTWYFSELLFAYFLTEFCGLQPSTMALLLAASFIFSAIADPLIGWLIVGLSRTLDQAIRLQGAGAVVSGVSVVIFSATGLVPPQVRLDYAIAASCLFRLAYAFYDVPQNAILSLRQADSNQRMSLSAIRMTGSGLASLTVATTAAFIVGADAKVGAQWFVWISTVFAIVGVLTALALRGQANPPATKAADDAPARPDPIAATRPPWRLMLALGVIAIDCATLGVFFRLEPYFTGAALQGVISRTVVLDLLALGSVASQPLWALVGRRISPSWAFAASAITVAGGAVVFVAAGGRSTPILATGGFLLGAGNGGMIMLLWSVFADEIADRRQHIGTLAPTVAFAVFTAVIKAASAVSVLLVGALLTAINYRNAEVATSWALLAPMACFPLAGAAMSLLAAPFLWRSLKARIGDVTRRQRPQRPKRSLRRSSPAAPP
jgi:Na+/melibiose symporter-like transporter